MRTLTLQTLPLGLCAECLERITKGREYQAIPLADGAELVHAYCSHREAGAHLIVREGKPHVWTIKVPIDALAWERHLALVPGVHAAIRRGIEGATKPAPGDVH